MPKRDTGLQPPDDLLPRREPGEEPIAREALEKAANPNRAPERNSDVYNLGPDARKGDPYDEDIDRIVNLEDEPGHRDIDPDQIQAMPGGTVEDDEDRELTARPASGHRPIQSDELPDG